MDNRDRAIRPEVLAAAIDRHAADDAVFTSDTGMSTVWLARFVTLRGTRRLLGSHNLESMANALPQALGAADLDRGRQAMEGVVRLQSFLAFEGEDHRCREGVGDGELTSWK